MAATRSEMLELARRMERYPEEFTTVADDDDCETPETISADSHEWEIIIEALRAAASAIALAGVSAQPEKLVA